MRGLALFLAIVALMLGCSRTDPVSTERAGTDVDPVTGVDASRFPTSFYPLTIGNRWLYETTVTLTTVIDGQPPQPPQVLTFQHPVEQICEESLDGQLYIVEEEVTEKDGVEIRTDWFRYRQDHDGLFEAAWSSTEPPDCRPRRAHLPNRIVYRSGAEAAAIDLAALIAARKQVLPHAGPLHPETLIQGKGIGESLRLKYPLYPGQEWLVRDEPGFFTEAHVEAVETLDLPVGKVPAFRIRFGTPGEPDSEVLMWYGRCGFLQQRSQGEGLLIDEDGEVIGVVFVDVLRRVTSIELQEVRGCQVARE